MLISYLCTRYQHEWTWMNNGICSKNLQNKYFLIVYNIIAFRFYIYILIKSFDMRERERETEREMHSLSKVKNYLIHEEVFSRK